MLKAGVPTLLRDVLNACRDFLAAPRGDRSRVIHQVAALPVRGDRRGGMEVLLISTRGSPDRLIIPRGWPMNGKADCQAAAIEAEEEAGVLGLVTLDPVGIYQYRHPRKRQGRPIRVDVYRLDVKRVAPTFKEQGRRRLVWLSAPDAARQVSEPGLVPIIMALTHAATDISRDPPHRPAAR